MDKEKASGKEERVKLLWNTVDFLRGEKKLAWFHLACNILIISLFVKICNAIFFYIIGLVLLHCCLGQAL